MSLQSPKAIEQLELSTGCIEHKHGKLYYSLNMSRDLKTDWHQDLEPRIDQHFQSIRNVGDISKQLLLASRHQDEARMKPSLVILCLSKRHQRAILKGFSSKDWRERFREKGVKLRVIVDKDFGEKIGGNKVGQLGALPSLSGPSYDNAFVSIALHGATTTLCGGQIRRLEKTGSKEVQSDTGGLNPPQETLSPTTVTNNEESAFAFATVGGIISINGIHYGLTVAHAFGKFTLLNSQDGIYESNESLDQSQSSLGTYASSTSQSLDDTLVEHDDEGYEVDTYIDGQQQPTILSPTPSIICPDTSFHDGGSIVAFGLGEHRESCFGIREQSTKPPSRPNEVSDWALLEILPSFDLPNLFIEPGSGALLAIEGMKKESEIHSGEVWVIAGRTKMQAGVINDASASVTLHQSHFVVLQVRLEHKLAAGDSGAWVIQDGKVCGMIIAASGLLPWAYMISIEKVFADIRYTLGGGTIEVPPNPERLQSSLQPQNFTLGKAQTENSTGKHADIIDSPEDGMSKAQSHSNFQMGYAARLQHYASGCLDGIQYQELSTYLLGQSSILGLGYTQTSFHNFATLHTFNGSSGSQVRQFRTVEEFYEAPQTSSALLFIQGYPSPEWLNAIGEKYYLDPNYYKAHLHSMLTKNQFVYPNLPSTKQFLTLRLTTIGHRLSSPLPEVLNQPLGLLRSRSSREMERYLRTMQLDHGKAVVGDSIVRDYSVFDDNYFAIEQDISICLHYTAKDKWNGKLITSSSVKSPLNSHAVIIWLDAGKELENGPDGPWQASGHWALTHATEFLPVIVHRSLNLYDPRTHRSRPSQHVRSLPQYYGKSMEPDRLARDPLYAITEMAEVAMASEVQFLNLITSQLEKKSTVQSDLSPRALVSDMSYLKIVLARHIERLQQNFAFIKNRGGSHWTPALPPSLERHPKEEALLQDIEYLVERALSIDTLCSQLTNLAMQRLSLSESDASLQQTRSIMLFTTITVIFIPLSFVTSVFSMNVSAFDRNSLVSIQFWVVPSTVIMVVSLFVLGLTPRYISKRFQELTRYLQHAEWKQFQMLTFLNGRGKRPGQVSQKESDTALWVA